MRRRGISNDVDADGKSCVPASPPRREAFLRNGNHCIVLHPTPQHASFMKRLKSGSAIQICKMLRHGNFASKAPLKQFIEASISDSDSKMAMPLRRTLKCKPRMV